MSLIDLERYEEARVLLRRTIRVARCVLGEADRLTLALRWTYAQSFYKDGGASLDQVSEAVKILEDVTPIAQRLLGAAHPFVVGIDSELRFVRKSLRACEARLRSDVAAACEAISPPDV